MSLKIFDGRNTFYQWDTGRKLVCDDVPEDSFAHFVNGKTGELLQVQFCREGDDLLCDVPDVLLQNTSAITVLVYVTDEHGKQYTAYKTQFSVKPRKRPPDYTYYNDAEEALEAHNAEILALTGTEQSTAEGAITEINATLAKTLHTNGVDVDNADTTANLVDKVGDIPSEYACLAATTRFCVPNVTAFDETTPTHYPSLYLPRIENASGAISFDNNKRVRVIGDVYVPLKKSWESIFRGAENLMRIGVLNIPSVTGIQYLFQSCLSLESIGGIVGKPETIHSAFAGCTKLVSVGGELDLSNVPSSGSTYGMFAGCNSLEEVGFVAGSIHVGLDFRACGKLNDSSRQSIKNGLADLTGQTIQTIYFHSDVLAKYTDDEVTEMILKNWNVM